MSQEELVELLIDGARFGDADDVQRALEGKVDVNAQDEWGKTGAPLRMADCEGWPASAAAAAAATTHAACGGDS